MKLPRHDHRELIHIYEWRFLAPAIMLKTLYLESLGDQLAKEVLKIYSDGKKAAAAGPPQPIGGLDAALAAAGAPTEEKISEKKAPPEPQKKKKSRLLDQLQERFKKRTLAKGEGSMGVSPDETMDDDSKRKKSKKRKQSSGSSSSDSSDNSFFKEPQLGEEIRGCCLKRSPGDWRRSVSTR